MFLPLNGRIAGISGILRGLLKPMRSGVGVSVAFVIGLVLAPLIYTLFAALPSVQIDVSYAGLVLAGLLVGVGTRCGGGCTSGHCVCGLSRLSVRSLVATLLFMGAGIVTVFIIRHVLGH